MQNDSDLPPTDFQELDDASWKELGFGGGLEIHQQLDTAKKLFCRCPVGISNEAPDARILRHMRPTLSEMGEYDCTALMEFKTKKNVTYELFSNCTCSYEMDDTPPFPLNQDALDIAIEISLLFNCSIIDEVHVTRKQYLDGSIPTGFQRTLVIGVGGWIPFKGKRLNITQVNLEEDACREMSDIGHNIIFRTDRLSTPLVEVITEKELFTPREMMEANREMGRVLRASGKVRRGSGSVRQDVNVSIAGGDRNEIKGVQRFQRVLPLTHFEALRQKALLDLRETLIKRGITEKKFKSEEKILTSEFRNLRSPFGTALFRASQVIGVIKLIGFAGLLGKELVPGRALADEFSDRIRVIACLDGKPNLFHSDAKKMADFLPADWETLQSEMRVRSDDALIVTFGNPEDVQTALDEIKVRAKEAVTCIPRETRQDIGVGITGFERVLPGPDRMYPDTDSEPVQILTERVERIRKGMPPRPWEKEEALRKLSVPEPWIVLLADSDFYSRFTSLVTNEKKLSFELARIICQYIPWLKRQGQDPTRLTDDVLLTLARGLEAKSLGQENLPDLLLEVCSFTPDVQDKELANLLGNLTIDPPEIRSWVKDAIGEATTSYKGKSPDGFFHAAMGNLLRTRKDLVVSQMVLDLMREEVDAASST